MPNSEFSIKFESLSRIRTALSRFGSTSRSDDLRFRCDSHQASCTWKRANSSLQILEDSGVPSEMWKTWYRFRQYSCILPSEKNYTLIKMHFSFPHVTYSPLFHFHKFYNLQTFQSLPGCVERNWSWTNVCQKKKQNLPLIESWNVLNDLLVPNMISS